MMIAYVKGWFLSWRTVAWYSNIYVIVPFCFLFLIPESPAWLVSKNRIEEARKSLDWFHKYQPIRQELKVTNQTTKYKTLN